MERLRWNGLEPGSGRIWKECMDVASFCGSRSGVGRILPADWRNGTRFTGCGFCRRVKARREGGSVSVRRMTRSCCPVRRGAARRGRLYSTCHAGVSEVVVPLFEGDAVHGGVPGGRCSGGSPGNRLLRRGIFRAMERIGGGADGIFRIASVLADLVRGLSARGGESLRQGECVRRDEIHVICRIPRAGGGNLEQTFFPSPSAMRDLAAACLSERVAVSASFPAGGRACPRCGLPDGTCRLKAARELLELLRRLDDLHEVMEQCGFRDQSRFGRLFREFTGYSRRWCTTGTFRRRTDVRK